jgi:hypothetical protein
MDSIRKLIIGNKVIARLIFNVNMVRKLISCRKAIFQKFYLANTYLHGQNKKYNVYQVMYVMDQNI